MDRIQEASNVITEINKYRNGEGKDYELITTICDYFDKIKNDKITQSDQKFLIYIANVIGIPHYYDLLNKFQLKGLDILDFDLNTFASVLYESTLHTSEKVKLHKYQKNILDQFEKNKRNRFVVSASTSFGKTFLVYEIIKKMDYKNVLLIFPTIALLSENHELIISDDRFKHFKKFRVHTLSDVEKLEEYNLFIFTPERFLSFTEKHDNAFDFAFVDEAYKIDNDFIIDESVKENERDVAYRIALHKLLLKNNDILLAGPYIEFSGVEQSRNHSFDNFMENNYFKPIDYNQYEIVNKTIKEIKADSTITLDENIIINFNSARKVDRLVAIIDELDKNKENSIVYCSTKSAVESYAKKIISLGISTITGLSRNDALIKHLEGNYDKEWIVVRALKHGIGIHHGSVPKYIQKEIINLFNKGSVKVLLSTTTITEGVNTSAKNVIVLHHKKGLKYLKRFDAKNIAGRAGRFQQHYSGRVIVLNNEFKKIIELPPEVIKHKNYDIESHKDEIDLFFTEEKYLNGSDQKKKTDIQNEQSIRGIPESIMSLYSVVSRMDKISIYDRISQMREDESDSIGSLIAMINMSNKIHIKYGGFQTIINIISPIVKYKKLKDMIDYKSISKSDSKEYSVLTHLVHFYLKDGFMGSVNYKRNNRDENIDAAIRETADFIYNTLKYHLVKYLGVFNVMYKFKYSQIKNINFDEIKGIDRLLLKLEYNAISPEGRLASDYGVPAKIVEYYDNPDERAQIQFDDYESKVFEKVEDVIKNSSGQ